jgi:hypothetical protein
MTTPSGDQPSLARIEQASDLPKLALPPEPSLRGPVLIVIASLVPFALIVGWMWNDGLFDTPSTDVGSKVLAAVLLLVGTLLTESLVLAGLILKHSIDLRTYQLGVFEQQRLQAESNRDHTLKVQEQQRLDAEAAAEDRSRSIEQERLRKDTVLKAIELLSDDSGNDAAPARQIGALQALATLGEYPLAVSLLDQRWSDKQSVTLPVPGALAVLDCVFHSTDPGIEHTQRQASSVLLYNAQKLITEDDVTLPAAITTGAWMSMTDAIELNLVLTLVEASAANFPGHRLPDSRSIRYVLSYLYVYASSERSRRNTVIAAHAGRHLARALPRNAITVVGANELDPDAIEARLLWTIQSDPMPAAAAQRIDPLIRWADGVAATR